MRQPSDRLELAGKWRSTFVQCKHVDVVKSVCHHPALHRAMPMVPSESSATVTRANVLDPIQLANLQWIDVHAHFFPPRTVASPRP